MFKSHILVAKFWEASQKNAGDIYVLCSKRSVDYTQDNRVFTVLSRSRRVVAVPFVIFFPDEGKYNVQNTATSNLFISIKKLTSNGIKQRQPHGGLDWKANEPYKKLTPRQNCITKLKYSNKTN